MLAFTCKFTEEGSKRSRICSLYISKKEHLQVNFIFSSLRASLSCDQKKEIIKLEIET